MAGDFNMVLSQEEKRGGSMVRDQFQEQVEDINTDWDIINVKPKRGKFKWTNRRNKLGHIAAILDRFLLQSIFLEEDSDTS
jgi:hypothetical protein